MITAESKDPRYLVQYSNGTRQANADVLPVKGGQDAGFGPHELLEASLATCINMWIRMQADRLGITVGGIAVVLTLRRDHPQEAVFEYTVKVDGVASEEDRAKLLKLAEDCPVRRTLSKQLTFQRLVP